MSTNGQPEYAPGFAAPQPFWWWWPVVASVALMVAAGAFLLPMLEIVYRVENWLTTWPFPELQRAERRDVFEEQLTTFLERERRLGYRPIESGPRLFGRMLSTLPMDIWDSTRAFASRTHWLFLRFKISHRLWVLGRFLAKLPKRWRAGSDKHQSLHRQIPLTASLGARAEMTATATVTAPGVGDNEYFLARQRAQTSLDAANQIVLQRRRGQRDMPRLA